MEARAVITNFQNETAIVTGAAHGIGRAIAERFAEEGAQVALFDFNYEAAAALAGDLRQMGHRTSAFKVDVSHVSQVSAAIEEVGKELGPPNILVNAAGIFTCGPLLEVTPEDWQRTIAVNLSGTFFCSQAVARYLIEKRSGRIINISSIGGKIGFRFNQAYCASKAGVLGLTRVLALDLAPYGVTVNAVCPGSTETDMFRQVDRETCEFEGLEPGTLARETAKSIPLGRLAHPRMIADLVAFLASPDAAHITGQAINVDGGVVMY
jgi:NAD(P)-dependent dehydrogenase (short-subunit alcohol dehydrogenase family)